MKPSEITNLRRDSLEPGVWRRAGMPKRVASVEAVPLAEFCPFGGKARVMLLSAGRALYVSVANWPGAAGAATDPLEAPRVFLGMLGGEPLEAEASDNGVVKIHCRRSAPEYVTCTTAGEFALRGPLPELPPLALYARGEGTLYVDTRKLTLTGASKGRSDSLMATCDLSIVSKELLTCYNALKIKAKAAGAGLQPVLARYRLRDVFGQTVALSAPVLLCAPSGFQCAEGVSLGSPDQMGSLSANFIEGDSYYMAVSAPRLLPAPWDSIVASARIEVSPQLDPVDPEGLCEGSFHFSGGETAQASLSFPGVPAVKEARLAAFRVLVASALERAEAIMEPVAEIARPFGGAFGAPGSSRLFSLPHRYVTSAGLAAVAPAPVSLPGTTYSARLTGGGLSLRANPSRRLPRPAPANELAAALADGAGDWKGVVAVRLSRATAAEVVVRETAGDSCCPAALGPLLVYPDAAAVEMTVNILRPDGSAVARSFPLTPLPDAGVAYWIDPSIARVALPAAEFGYEVPLELVDGEEAEWGVDVFLSGFAGEMAPDSPVGRVSFNSEVVAMAAAPRSRPTWDVSRRRVLCFGESGTVMLTFDSNGVPRSETVVDRRPVRSAAAVCEADDSGGAALLLVAGGDLLRFAGTKVETLLAACRAERPGWCGAWKAVWLFGGGGPPRRLAADGSLIAADLPGITEAARCRQWRGRLLIGCAGALYDASAEEAVESLPFSLSLDTEASSRVAALEAGIFAADIDGRLVLSGHNGSEIFGRLAGFSFRSQLNGPLRLPLKAPLRRYLRVTVSGTASPDLSLRGLSVSFAPHSPHPLPS